MSFTTFVPRTNNRTCTGRIYILGLVVRAVWQSYGYCFGLQEAEQHEHVLRVLWCCWCFEIHLDNDKKNKMSTDREKGRGTKRATE
jgi:hypothetical protein